MGMVYVGDKLYSNLAIMENPINRKPDINNPIVGYAMKLFDIV